MANQKTRVKNLIAKKFVDMDISAITGSVTLGSNDVVDLNGEADALVLDADGNTSISAPTDNQIDIEVNGADDFKITANTFTALSGSTIATNTIAETTAASGVTIDGVLVKDGGVTAVAATAIATDIISEVTGAAGVTVDGVLLKDGGVVLAGAAAVSTDVISEKTSATGVTIDGLLVKDGIIGTIPVITGDGAITIANGTVELTKGSAAAITIAAPTSGTHDGIKIWVYAGSAQAHVITCSTDGFNAKGSSGTVTFTAALGNSVLLHAQSGHWYTLVKNGVTVA